MKLGDNEKNMDKIEFAKSQKKKISGPTETEVGARL
jgi:hypothetical protein